MTDGGSGQRAVDRVTLRAVAARAGVSKSVVSRALQGGHNVSAKSMQAVQQAIADLGYRPNAVARTLTSRRSGTVGVMISDLRHPWVGDFLEGLHTTLHAHHLHAMLADARLDRATDERLLQTFMEMRFDGLVLVGTLQPSATIDDAVRWLPTVVAGSRDFHLPQVDVVAEDDWRGVELALEHLHDLGHTAIAQVTCGTARVFRSRVESYVAWMRANGLADQIQVAECDGTDQGAHRAGLELLAGSARPTAVLAANDIVAAGLLGAARDLGLVVPQDVSVVGFDNSSLARLSALRLTSVDISPRLVGELTGQRLVERIADPGAEGREDLMPASLVARSTTGPAPARH